MYTFIYIFVHVYINAHEQHFCDEMLQNPESVLSLNVKMLSQESAWLSPDSTDMSLIVFLLKTWTHNLVFSRTESDLLPQSSGHFNQYAGPTGRETCGIIYEKVFDFCLLKFC